MPLISFPSFPLCLCRFVVFCLCSRHPRGTARSKDPRAEEQALPRGIPELGARRIICRLLVWTAGGRPNPAAVRTLHKAARRAELRSDGTTARGIFARWTQKISVVVRRRRAAMARAVLAPQIATARLLRDCATDRPPDPGNRAEPLDEDEGVDDDDPGACGAMQRRRTESGHTSGVAPF